MGREDQGAGADRYTVIPRTLIFLFRGDQVLLLKGSPQKRLWANRYNGIGGHLERGEGAEEAARRELKEETGLNAALLRLCGTVLINAGAERGVCLLVYWGEAADGEPQQSEEGALTWVRLAELPQLPLVEDLYQLIPAVLRSRETQIPFSARYWYDEQNQLRVEISG